MSVIPNSYTTTVFRPSAPPNAFFNLGSTIEPTPSWMKSVNPKKINDQFDETVTKDFVEDGPPNQMDVWRLNNASAVQDKRIARGLVGGKAPEGLTRKRVKRSKGTESVSVSVKGAKRAVGSKKSGDKKKKQTEKSASSKNKKADKKKTSKKKDNSVKTKKSTAVKKEKKKSETINSEVDYTFSSIPQPVPDKDYLF